MSLTPTLVSGGLYKIINVASATLMTLSPKDGHSIQGYLDSNQDNQMWLAEEFGNNSWALKSFYIHEGKAVYLSYVGNKPDSRVLLTGSADSRAWNITQSETHGGAEYKIIVPNTPERGFLADLDKGKHEDGTVIALWMDSYSDTGNQHWLFQKIPIPD